MPNLTKPNSHVSMSVAHDFCSYGVFTLSVTVFTFIVFFNFMSFLTNKRTYLSRKGFKTTVIIMRTTVYLEALSKITKYYPINFNYTCIVLFYPQDTARSSDIHE